jgi:hypothetical protein
MQHLRQRKIGHELPAAGEQTAILAPRQRPTHERLVMGSVHPLNLRSIVPAQAGIQ